MFIPRFCSAILISVLTLPVQASILLALTPVEIVSIAKKSVVRIDGANTGSGFIVKKSGNTYTVLTNAHVLQQSGNYQLLAPDGRSYPLSVKQLFPSKIDLAEAEFTSDRDYQVAELGDIKTLMPGSNIYSYGWNASSTALGDRSPQLLPGSVSSIKSGKTYQGYNLVYTLNRVPGMSGSPLYNDQGKVVGVYGLGDSETTLTLGISIDTYTDKRLITLTNLSPQATTTTNVRFNAEYYLRQGNLKLDNKDWKGAILDFDHAIAINPSYGQAYNYRGLAKYSINDYEVAILDYQKALSLNPQYASAYFNLGLVKSELGDVISAIGYFRKASMYFTMQGLKKDADDSNKEMKRLENTVRNIPEYIE